MQVKDLKDVPNIVSKFGWMQPAQVMAGCGVSAGFKINGENSLFSNSVAQFGEKTILCCKCPFCGEEVEAVITGGRIYCPKEGCGKSAPYSKPSN